MSTETPDIGVLGNTRSNQPVLVTSKLPRQQIICMDQGEEKSKEEKHKEQKEQGTDPPDPLPPQQGH